MSTFEIHDFTCVSPFERLVSEIEQILEQWGVAHNKLPVLVSDDVAQQMRKKHEADATEDAVFSGVLSHSNRYVEQSLEYGGVRYLIKYFHGGGDLVTDQVAGRNPLQKTLGLNYFITCKVDDLYNRVKSDTTAILSALAIATSNVRCIVPYLAADELGAWRGGLQSSLMRIDVRAAKEPPVSLQYLSGILDFLEERVKSMYFSMFVPDFFERIQAMASCSVTFRKLHIQKEENEIPEMQRNNSEERVLLESRLLAKDNCTWRPVASDNALMFGAFWGPQRDPLEALELTASWSYFASGAFVENAVYSDLDPLQAPFWHVSVSWAREGHWLDSPLSDAVRRLVELRDAAVVVPTLSDVPISPHEGETLEEESKLDENNTFMALRAVHSIKSSIEQAANAALYGPCIPSEVAVVLVDDVFTEKAHETAQQGNWTCKGCRTISPVSELTCDFCGESQTESTAAQFPMPECATSPDPAKLPAPYGSLLSRLTMKLLDIHLDNHWLNEASVLVVWTAFTKKVRESYETKQPLPFVPLVDKPDFLACLLHQKLQLIQLCISMELERNDETTTGDAKTSAADASVDDETTAISNQLDSLLQSSSDDDDDTFFDATDEADSVSTCRPVGRKEWLRDCYLLNNEREKLYLPVTQHPAVYTLDLFEERERLLEQLGSHPDSAHLRRNMQTRSLVSDMESFKAANPDAEFSDFVRWYSPVDFDEDTKQLSVRMQVVDCEWQVLWQSASSRSAKLQPPLFNFEKEAERALTWMESVIQPHDLLSDFSWLAVSHTLCSFNRTEGSHAGMKTVEDTLAAVGDSLRKSKVASLSICDDLAHAELVCAQATSLLSVFWFSKKMVEGLLRTKRAEAKSKDEKTFMADMFQLGEEELKQDYISPVRREYTVVSKMKAKKGESAYREPDPTKVPDFYNRLHVAIGEGQFKMSNLWNPFLLEPL